MDKDKARQEIERIFEQYSGFTPHFLDWGDDDLRVVIQDGVDNELNLYLCGEDGEIYLYTGDDIIEPLTEAGVWRMMFFEVTNQRR